MLKKAILIYFSFSLFYNLNAQELSLYRNYMFNNLYNLNAAAAGYDGAFVSQLTVSKKWLGIKDSPSGEVFSNSIRLGEEEFYDPKMHLNRPFINLARRVGLGFTLYNENNGPLRHTGLLFAYAYHLPLFKGRISFGLSGLLSQYKLNTDEFRPIDEDDPALYNNSSAIVPDVNAGVMFYNRRLFAGISANRLANFNTILDHTNTLPDIVICGGYKFDINSELKFEPSVFFVRSGNEKLSLDLNGKLYFSNKYWLLLSYQSNHEILFGLSLQFKPGFQLCYSYAVNTSGLATYNAGSQIISLHVNIASLVKKHN
jgi:type IX secretion system PorP/SprF family membrane protein